MKNAKSLCLRLNILVVSLTIIVSSFMNVAVANDYPPDSQFTSIPTNNSVARPNYLGSYIDPEFDTHVIRITDRANQSGNAHPYPKRQAWNRDMSLLKLGYRIYDPETFVETGITAGLTNGEAYSKLGSPGYEIRWSNVDANKLYALGTSFKFKQVIINGTQTTVSVLHDFSAEGYSELYIGYNEGNLDYSDQYVVLVGKKPNTSDVFGILYDIQSDLVVWTQVLPHSDWDAAYGTLNHFDWITVSPHANHILLSTSGQIYQYDINLSNEYLLATEAAHGDIGIHQNGDEYYVQFQFGNQGIWGYNLETHQSTRLLPDKYNGGHVSCRNYLRTGWCYINTSKEGYKEVFALKLDNGSGTVERFAQTHVSITNRGLTQVGVSPDGTRILFGSDWGNTANSLDTYQAQIPSVAITAPIPGSTLSGNTEYFSWSANGVNVSEWWLYVGGAMGGNDYYDSGSLGTSTNTTVTGLPTDGSTVYVRLWYKEDGSWKSLDTTYIADNSGVGIPLMAFPIAGSTLAGATDDFLWSPNGASVTEWWLYVGSAEGEHDYYNSGSLGLGSSDIVTVLPTDGSMVYVRLWYLEGVWKYIDLSYVADNSGGALPEISNPAEGATLPMLYQSFTWSSNGTNATEWWIYAGSAIGMSDYYDSGSLGSSTNTLVDGWPLDGSTIYVRLWYKEGIWKYIDRFYIAGSSGATSSP